MCVIGLNLYRHTFHTGMSSIGGRLLVFEKVQIRKNSKIVLFLFLQSQLKIKN